MRINVACVTDATKLLVKSVYETVAKSLFKAPALYLAGFEYLP